MKAAPWHPVSLSPFHLGQERLRPEREVGDIFADFYEEWGSKGTAKERADVEQRFLIKLRNEAVLLERAFAAADNQPVEHASDFVYLRDKGKWFRVALDNIWADHDSKAYSPTVGLQWDGPANALTERFSQIENVSEAKLVDMLTPGPPVITPHIEPSREPRGDEGEFRSGIPGGRKRIPGWDDFWDFLEEYGWIILLAGGGIVAYNLIETDKEPAKRPA